MEALYTSIAQLGAIQLILFLFWLVCAASAIVMIAIALISLFIHYIKRITSYFMSNRWSIRFGFIPLQYAK